MSDILVFDTETTGLPDFPKPSGGEQQPHLVQLAALVVCLETREIKEEMNELIIPEGWVSCPEALETHGITTEKATADGIPESDALDWLLNMWRECDHRVGHNQSFDARIVRIATCRYQPEDVQDAWKAGKSECTALMSKPICKLPPTAAMKRSRFRNTFKTPKLTEAYKHFFGREMEGAHDAMADVRGCMEIYWHMKDLGNE